jgi:histone H3
LRIKSSVLFWYFLISLKATVPGLKRWGFFTPPVAGADLRAAFVASCLRGALPPVDFLAVCLVRAIERDLQVKEENLFFAFAC